MHHATYFTQSVGALFVDLKRQTLITFCNGCRIWQPKYLTNKMSATRFPMEATSIMKLIVVLSRKGVEIYELRFFIYELSPEMVQIWLKSWVGIAKKCTKDRRTEHVY